MSAIQFLIIGAQKGGTTSLFEYMRRHPQIQMPANKEISFFDLNYSRGEEWYLASVLRNARPGAVCGEASVGYMCGTPYGEFRNDRNWDARMSARHGEPLENVIPGRIERLLPEVRLICVLRDPVARAYSHYSMARLGKAETRSFDQAVEDLLAQDAMEHARAMPLSDNGYIANGEYGRVLAGYLRTFANGQLKVVFSDELSNSPADTLAQVFEVVGVDAGYEPENLDTRYRAAALEPRVQGLDLYAWQRRLAAASPARAKTSSSSRG